MNARKPIGIIDTLSYGFVAVTRHLWLLLLPFALDLYLWLGPRLSIRPLFDRLAAEFAALPASEMSAEMASEQEFLVETVQMLGGNFNLFSLLIPQSIGMPSLLADPFVAPDSVSPMFTVGNPLLVLLAMLLFVVGGLLIGALWLGLVARAVRLLGEPGLATRWAPERWLRRGLIDGGRLLVVGLIFVAASLALLPLFLVLGLVAAISPALGMALSAFLMIAIVWLMLWLGVHFYFVVQAIVLNNAGPVRALVESFQVVGRNFWGSLLFIVLIFLISRGLGLIWLNLATSTFGLLVAIAANAYVGTSLLAASFIFFADRYQLWQSQRVQKKVVPGPSKSL